MKSENKNICELSTQATMETGIDLEAAYKVFIRAFMKTTNLDEMDCLKIVGCQQEISHKCNRSQHANVT